MKPAVYAPSIPRVQRPAPAAPKPVQAPAPTLAPALKPMRRPDSTILECPTLKGAVQMADARQSQRNRSVPAAPPAKAEVSPSRARTLRIAAASILIVVAMVVAWVLLRSKPQALKAADAKLEQI